MATPTSEVDTGESASGHGDVSTAAGSSGKRPSTGRSVLEWVAVFVGAALVAILLKTFVVQAFYIPSESMVPTLEVGDRVLVNKLSYRLHPVNRGDVVVFERPEAESEDIKDLIKRVIALPGETVVIQDDQGQPCGLGGGGVGCHVYVNGTKLAEPYLPPNTPNTSAPSPPPTYPHRCTPDDPCTIPQGSVWVMGDNRANSKDSRYFGPITEDRIIGRAFVTVWPFSRLGGL